MYRTHACGTLRAHHAATTLTVSGWVQRCRRKGKIVWIDLRDASGIVQLVLEEGKSSPLDFALAHQLGREYVVQATGEVVLCSAPNPHLPTGAIEIAITKLQLLNASQLPPFLIEEPTDAKEELRMKYRYLDLRRPPLQRNLLFRHQLSRAVRNWLENHGFIEVETPLLVRPTPEGARDYIVPSRQHKASCYTLPQSPQLLKQLLMIGGIERYYQLARCFRDEDLRTDRQPEFTQLDCEMAFAEQEDILQHFETLFLHLLQTFTQTKHPPLSRLTYAHAMERYGSDRPDLRWEVPLQNATPYAHAAQGATPLRAHPWVGSLCLPGGSSVTRRQLQEWSDYAARQSGTSPTLYTLRWHPDQAPQSSLSKYYTPQQLQRWLEESGAKRGDLLLCLGGEREATQLALGHLRNAATRAFLPPLRPYAALWVTDFPLLTWDTEQARYTATHHPFTAPLPSDLHLLEENPAQVRSQAYDLVLNGTEVGGGSVRIHQPELQRSVLSKLGYTPAQQEHNFGFLLQALSYGAPPHGGIAWGLDRLCLLLGGGTGIREYIAFPKNNSGRDTMLDAPAPLDDSTPSFYPHV